MFLSAGIIKMFVVLLSVDWRKLQMEIKYGLPVKNS